MDFDRNLCPITHMENQGLHITRTAEFVTPKHPDKLCDRIADSLLDEYLKHDQSSRVALEVTGGHGKIFITGEVTSNHTPDYQRIVRHILESDRYEIIINITEQSPEIAGGVDNQSNQNLGAGDQGIVIGYACSETPELLPLEYVLARDLCQKIYQHYPVDGKVQVTINKGHAVVVVASYQNINTNELAKIVEELLPGADNYIINPAGEWSVGGFNADSGTVGRKLSIDNYGPRVRIGGGAFSGKDLSKTDRSGAYFARHLAVNILKQTNANEVEVELAFAIGVAEPVARNIIVRDGSSTYHLPKNLSPREYIQELDLSKVRFADVCQWGHFGHQFPWEK